MILKTDRKTKLETVEKPVIETPPIAEPTPEPKTEMDSIEGGKGTMSQRQMITLLIVVVVIVVVIVLAVYFYNKHKKSPLTVQ